MAPFLFPGSQNFDDHEARNFCLDDEWFCRFKFENVENHEMWIQGISLATLLTSNVIHMINGISNIKDNTGAEYEVKCVVINLVSCR